MLAVLHRKPHTSPMRFDNQLERDRYSNLASLATCLGILVPLTFAYWRGVPHWLPVEFLRLAIVIVAGTAVTELIRSFSTAARDPGPKRQRDLVVSSVTALVMLAVLVWCYERAAPRWLPHTLVWMMMLVGVYMLIGNIIELTRIARRRRTSAA